MDAPHIQCYLLIHSSLVGCRKLLLNVFSSFSLNQHSNQHSFHATTKHAPIVLTHSKHRQTLALDVMFYYMIRACGLGMTVTEHFFQMHLFHKHIRMKRTAVMHLLDTNDCNRNWHGFALFCFFDIIDVQFDCNARNDPFSNWKW